MDRRGGIKTSFCLWGTPRILNRCRDVSQCGYIYGGGGGLIYRKRGAEVVQSMNSSGGIRKKRENNNIVLS